jgi:drug/metabolite transporter (DMT)-like permease
MRNGDLTTSILAWLVLILGILVVVWIVRRHNRSGGLDAQVEVSPSAPASDPGFALRDSQAITRPFPHYIAFCIGVVFWALFAPKELSRALPALPNVYALAAVLIAVAYCLVIPWFLRLRSSFGLTALLAVLGLVLCIGVPPGVDPKTVVWFRCLAVAALIFYYACIAMFFGLIFYGVRRLFSARRKGPSETHESH